MLTLYLSTGLSTISLIIAIAALVVSRRLYELPKAKLTDLEQDSADYEYAIASLRQSIKRLNARVGMNDARARIEAEKEHPTVDVDSKDASQLNGESPAQWKARMRRIIHTKNVG